MKKVIVIPLVLILSIILAYVVWYLLSPLFIVVEVNQESPLSLEDAMEKMENESLDMQESMPEAQVVYSGDFVASAHSVQGEALYIDTLEGGVLRFEDFFTDNGPQLHIYLSTSTGTQDFIDLGPIKATKGNINYELPPNLDIEKYNHVLVWCKPFGVLFNYAVLS